MPDRAEPGISPIDRFGLSKNPSYSKVTGEYQRLEGASGWDVSIVAKEPIVKAEPVSIFTPDEMKLLTDGEIVNFHKFLSVEGFAGELHANMLEDRGQIEGGAEYLRGSNFFSPEKGDFLTPEDYGKYPFSFGLCLNNSEKRTPDFSLHIPGVKEQDFLSRVEDWDVVGDRYDATHYTYRLKDPTTGFVNLAFTSNPAVLSGLQIAASNRVTTYPNLA